MKNIQRILTGVCLALTACSTPQYSQRDSLTTQMGDNTVRYGSIAALGAGGYFTGKELGGSDTTGAVGAVTGVAAGYGIQKLGDSQKQRAYRTGQEDGANAARAEQLEEQWKREAIYNAPPLNQAASASTKIRQIYVPSYTSNGITYPGEYQYVEIER